MHGVERQRPEREVQSYLEWPGVKRTLGVELSATRAKHAWEAWESLLLSDEAQRDFNISQREVAQQNFVTEGVKECNKCTHYHTTTIKEVPTSNLS